MASGSDVQLDTLEDLLDRILGRKTSSYMQSAGDLLARVEIKLETVLDRHHPGRVEDFQELVGSIKSPSVKEKNIKLFAKSIMAELIAHGDAVRDDGSVGGGNKRAGEGASGPPAKKPRPTAAATLAVAGAARTTKPDKTEAPAPELMVPKPAVLEVKQASLEAKVPKVPALPAASYQKIPVEPAERVLQGSDGKLRGELQIVERYPALVYRSWADVDHDVYMYGLHQLGSAQRRLRPDGYIVYFLGFGQYKDYTHNGFKGFKMAGETLTADRDVSEIVDLFNKGLAMKNQKQEGSRKNAYRDALKWLYTTVYKQSEPPEDILKYTPAPPAKKKKSTGGSSATQKRAPRPRSRSTGHQPAAAAAALHGTAAASAGQPASSDAKMGTGAGGVNEATAPTAPTPEPEPPAPPPTPDENDRSIPGLFALLRYRLQQFEDLSGTDGFIWSLKSSQSNVENLCEQLFSDVDNPDGDEWRRMITNGFDKAKKKMDDKIKSSSLDGQRGEAALAMSGLFEELQNAIENWDGGEAVDGWDDPDYGLHQHHGEEENRSLTPEPEGEEVMHHGAPSTAATAGDDVSPMEVESESRAEQEVKQHHHDDDDPSRQHHSSESPVPHDGTEHADDPEDDDDAQDSIEQMDAPGANMEGQEEHEWEVEEGEESGQGATGCEDEGSRADESVGMKGTSDNGKMEMNGVEEEGGADVELPPAAEA